MANNSVKGDGISGKVRGRRKVLGGREAAWETWCGWWEGESGGLAVAPSAPHAGVPTGRCASGPHGDTHPSRVQPPLGGGRINIKSKGKASTAGLGIPSQPGKAASSYLSGRTGKSDGCWSALCSHAALHVAGHVHGTSAWAPRPVILSTTGPRQGPGEGLCRLPAFRQGQGSSLRQGAWEDRAEN